MTRVLSLVVRAQVAAVVVLDGLEIYDVRRLYLYDVRPPTTAAVEDMLAGLIAECRPDVVVLEPDWASRARQLGTDPFPAGNGSVPTLVRPLEHARRCLLPLDCGRSLRPLYVAVLRLVPALWRFADRAKDTGALLILNRARLVPLLAAALALAVGPHGEGPTTKL